MDPCHSVSPRSPARTSTVTVAHLIRNIEQLKNKDKLISQLEKDLGHQWVSAHQAALERAAVASAACTTYDGGAGEEGVVRDHHQQACLPGGATAASPAAVTALDLGGGRQQQQACGPSLPSPSYTLSSVSAIFPPTTVTLGSNDATDDPTEISSRTPSSTATTSGVEDAWSPPLAGFPLSKHDLQKALKESKERNKELVEKCRAYLHRTKDLTAQNRAYKDSSVKLLEENKKMQELLEHSKLRCLQLSRQASDASAERNWAQQTSQIMEQARMELTEAHKTIAALKQACSDKDRRIELIQHRKKRRRLLGPDERSIGGETYFGFEEDTNSVDSSMSRSTMSDDDVWDEVLSREETERNYQRLMMEQLQLQKSHALLQKQTGQLQDPQREEKGKQELQDDLFEAQCRIEKLEMLLADLGQGETKVLMKEREIMKSNLRASQRKLESSESETRRLQQALNEATAQVEDLEFQLVEMEQQAEEKGQVDFEDNENPPCPEPPPPPSTPRVDPLWEQPQLQQQQYQQTTLLTAPPTELELHHHHHGGLLGGGEAGSPAELREGGDGADHPSEVHSDDDSEGEEIGAGYRRSAIGALIDSLLEQQKRLQADLGLVDTAGGGMEQLRSDLAALLKGRGRDAESALKRLENLTAEEKNRSEALEYMAHELQMKVIALQQEMDSPKAKPSQTKGQQKTTKPDNSVSAALAREKQENLELKAQLTKHSQSQELLVTTEKQLTEELTNWKAKYEHLNHQMDLLTQQQKQNTAAKTESCVQTSRSSPPSATTKTHSPPLTELTRKNSKDRKSRPRSGDDPTATKRRRSSYEIRSENDDLPPMSPPKLKNAKSVGDLNPGGPYSYTHPRLVAWDLKSSCRSTGDAQVTAHAFDDQDKENQCVSGLREELHRVSAENIQLKDQLHQYALVDKNTRPEADQRDQQHSVLERMNRLDGEASFLRMENETLRARLQQQQHQQQHHHRLHDDSSSSSSSEFGAGSQQAAQQLSELEECVESLREQVDAREAVERQLRERLRLVEASALEAESAELSARERYEELLAREAENSRQARQLQQTCRELQDILVDKEIVEQGLTDKVDFLQRAEAASVKRVEELEAENKELRGQLQEAVRLADDTTGGGSGASQRELNKIQELKHQMTFLETDNRALQARVAELEENEETLRENWRRVAEEDFSRIQGLEEKMKTLDTINKQLKVDLAEAQEYFVINTVSETSLAAELANSQSQLTASGESGDNPSQNPQENVADAENSIGGGMVRKDSEKRTLRDKVNTLERQLSDVAEKKNTTIENLQEKIVGLKENEIKLSETISEMEMTEREIRAKLALYESSEVTVEKMLKYQSKIEELKTSQESLLDQLETMENQEMTLQEKMQEMERTLRGKIVTLEVEIKGVKTKELKDAARIRELEKQEKELSEKTVQQAEKENGLYVKISTLMDEAKTAKEQVETLRAQLTDKEDKVRKAKLLEVKFLEIEMEYGKKMSDLSSKLRRTEEELRQKEVAHQEEIRAIREEILSEDTEHQNKMAILEQDFSEKEKEREKTVADLKKQVSEVSGERDAFESQLTDMAADHQRLNHELEMKVSSLEEEVSVLNFSERESQSVVAELRESLQLEKARAETAENEVKTLKEDLISERKKVSAIEGEVTSLKADLAKKAQNIAKNLEKENEFEKEKQGLADELEIKAKQVVHLEKQLEQQTEFIAELEARCVKLDSDAELLQGKASDKEAEHERKLAETLKHLDALETSLSQKENEFEGEKLSLMSKCKELETEANTLKADQASNKNTITELESKISTMEKEHALKVSSFEDEQKVLENELNNKIMFLNTQLSQEVQTRESEKSALQHSNQREQSLSSEITKLQKQVESHKKELVEKLSELEAKNKEHCELSLQLSNTKHAGETLRHEFETFKDAAGETEKRLKTEISQKNSSIEGLNADLKKARDEIAQMEIELLQKENLVADAGSQKDKLAEEKQQEITKLQEEKAFSEQMVQEHIQKSESSVLQCKQEHQTQVESLTQRLAEEEERCQQLEEDKQALVLRSEDLQSQIQTLELYLSEVNFKLDSKSSQCRKREEELDSALAEHKRSESEVKRLSEQLEHFKGQLAEKNAEVSQKASENSDSMSLISAKQRELEDARTELKKCLKDIEHFKTEIHNKEEEIKAKDHEHQVLLTKCEKLSKQNQDRDAGYKQLESQVTGYERKLKEAENRYRELEAKCASLEVQLQERFAQAQQGESILKAKEEERQELVSKLAEVEEKFGLLAEEVETAKNMLAEKEEQYKSLEIKLDSILGEKSQIEQMSVDRSKMCEELQSKLDAAEEQFKKHLLEYKAVCSQLKDVQEKSVDTKTKLYDSERNNDQQREKLATAEEQISFSNQQISELTGRLQLLQGALEERETSHRDAESGLQTLEQQHLEAKIECQNLKSRVTYFQEMNSHTQALCEEREEKLKEMELALDRSRAELLESQNQLSEKENSLLNLVAEFEQSKAEMQLTIASVRDLEKKVEELQSINAQMSESNATLQSNLSEKVAACSKLETEIRESEEKMRQDGENAQEMKSELDSVIAERNALQQSRFSLEQKADSVSLEKTAIESSVSTLEQKLTNLALERDDYINKLNFTEREKSELEADRSSLRRELEEVRINLESSSSSKTNIEEKLKELSDKNATLEVEVSNLQKELNDKQEEKRELEQRHELSVKESKEKTKLHEDQIENHSTERQALESRLQEAKAMCHELVTDLDRFKEEMNNNAQTLLDLEDQLKQKCSENEILKSHLDSQEKVLSVAKDNSEVQERVEALQSEIESFRKSDSAREEKLKQLEKELLSVREREHRMSHRVEELESKEKELLEQMADIEVTVIVPLETENQELKDEIGIVKQERDEAVAKISKWDDDADEEQQTTENVHKCLEDTLMQRDELEKKVGILLEDINKLETERDSMSRKISDLQSNDEEAAEKYEELEMEVERLRELEKQTSVVEEAETRLMDQVLDLEEREHKLASELQGLKEKEVRSLGSQTGDLSFVDMTERLKYLEQKVEVLQDAEGRYMDTIMELEETKANLLAKLAENKDTNAAAQSENKDTNAEENKDTNAAAQSAANTITIKTAPEETEVYEEPSVFTTSVTSFASIKLAPISPQMVVPVLAESQSGVDSQGEPASDCSSTQLQGENEKLAQEVAQSSEKIKELEVKLELLQDSEARLMERLLETEARSENAQPEQQKYDDGNNSKNGENDELRTKVETLTEENEFLAGSIENYKQLYKEEREKTNALHERVLEDSSVFHELEEARGEIDTLQNKMEDMEAEHSKRFVEKQKSEAELISLLEQSYTKERELQEQVLHLEKQLRALEDSNSELKQKDTDLHILDQRLSDLDQNNRDLREEMIRLQDNEARLQQEVSTSQAREKTLEQQVRDLEQRLSDLDQKKRDLQEEMVHLQDNEAQLQQEMFQLQEKEARLQQEMSSSQAREKTLELQVRDLEVELQEQRSRLEEEHSVQSDSGVSGDSHKTRYDSFEKDPRPVKSPSPVLEERFSSSTSINLSRPPAATSPPQITARPAPTARRVAPSPAHSTHTTTSSSPAPQSPVHHDVHHSPQPVAPPRTRSRRSRPVSIDSISQEELVFLVEELQGREAVLKRRVLDLEAITDVDLPQRVEELEKENKQLQNRLDQARQRNADNSHNLPRREENVEGTYVTLTNPSYFYPGGDSNNNSSSSNNNNSNHNHSRDEYSRRDSAAMLDKPGEVLQQRIKELEHLDSINKNQLSELERDREVLHEIARKDKATIHDLNVRIRELQLSERSLKEQVNSLEVSESSLFSRCEDLDTTRSCLEDRVHELEVHERRLRELVRRLKLDEERWLGRSGGMETALGELSASESQLKRMLQDSELEKGGLAERTSYMEARVRELEAVEASLSQKVKVLQSNEAILQKKLAQIENSEAAAHSKAGELDVINADLSQRLQAGLEERAMLATHVQQLHGQIQELDRRLLASRDSEMAYKQHVESLQKNESSLQKRVREFELREIDSQARVRELEQTQEILGDKMAALQRSENRLKYRVQELEGIGGQIPGEMTPDQKQKVPQKLEDCQKRVVVLQNHVANLQLQLRENLKQSQQKFASTDDAQKTVSVPVSELNQLRARSALLEESTYQMQEVEHLNEELNDTILKLREGKGASGREVEVEVLKRRLASYKACIAKLKSSLSPGQATSLVDPELDSDPDGETLPARRLRGLESERVLQSVRGLEDGKTNDLTKSSKQGLTAQESAMVQSKAASTASSAPISLDLSFAEDSSVSADMNQGKSSSKQPPDQEENHWRAIEARRMGAVAGSPRGEGATHNNAAPSKPNAVTGMPGGGGVATSTPRPGATTSGGGRKSGGGVSTPEIEEVTIGLHLQSESELSSHYAHLNRTLESAQNDTDSSLSPVPPPRRARKSTGGKGTLTRGATTNSTRPHSSHNGGDGGDDGVNNHNNSSSSNESGDGNNNAEASHRLSADHDAVVATTNQKLFFGDSQKKPLPHQAASSGSQTVTASASTTSQTQPSRTPLASFGGQDSFYLPSPAQDGEDSLDDDDVPPPPLPASQPPGIEVKGEGSEGSQKSQSPTQGSGASRKDSLDNSTSGMSIRQRIAMIEKQLQSDQFDSRVDSDHELRGRTQEALKQVELVERDNKHMKEDISKLEKELEEKRRHINTLEVWLSSLDDLLKNKNKQTDREMVEQLQLDLGKLRSELKRSGYRPEGEVMDPAALRTELEHRDREIVSRRNEVQALVEELRKCKDECRSIEGMRRTALDSLRDLEQEVLELQEKEIRLEEAQEELEELKSRTEKTREVFEENLLLREKVHQGELELRRLRGLCDDFNNLSARYEELETQKQQAVDMLQPLQAKLERLARKCQQKDALLLELGDELRHNSSRQSRALDELDRMRLEERMEEYNTDFPQLTNGLASQQPRERRPPPSRLSSMEELDSHFNPVATTRERRKRPTPYVNRPRSADGILSSGRLDGSSPSHHHSLQHVAPFYQAPRESRRSLATANVVEGKFRAIADYDPSLFSQSGRPGLELELVEGDVVTVTGPMDRTGYYEAEVKGRSGLVPANYLLPLQGGGGGAGGLLPRRPGMTSTGQPSDQSPEHILDMFNQLQQGAPAQRSHASGTTSGLPHDAWPPSSQLQQGAVPLPDPPSNLHVREGNDSDGTYLLSWKPPKLDAHGCNNGLQVLGYMVYVDNVEYEQVPSAVLCQVVLEGLKPGQTHTLAVQALCGSGQASPKAQLLFQGVVRGQGQNGRQGQGHGEGEGQGKTEQRKLHVHDTDLSSVLDKVHHKRGHKRRVLALYDYSPHQQSPGDYPHLELAFQAGDLLSVYGEARPDGFLHGEVDGKRGLVPACFVEDVSESSRSTQRVPAGQEGREVTV